MGIIYNEDTAIILNERKYTDYLEQTEQETKGLSANTSDNITNRFSFTHALGVNYTATQSIILTALSLSASAVPPNIITIYAFINDLVNQIADLSTRNGSVSKIIPFPNWILREGDVLAFTQAGVGDCEGEFIGYYA